MPETSTQPKPARGRRLPEQPVILVPGCHFFTALAALPAGTPEKEIPGLAALALEADSPFGEDQLARGHFALPGGSLVVFAMLRRKLAAAQEQWAKAAFVVPDFATWLPRAEAVAGVVLLETHEAVTALEFGPGSAVPRRIVSRPVPADVDAESGIAIARELVLARVEPASRGVRRFRLAETPCTLRGAKFEFHWVPQDAAAGRNAEPAVLTPAQLWAMDLREPAFLRVKRRDFQWNRYAWGTLMGVGLAAVLLFAGELGLIGAQILNAARQNRIEAQTPGARAAEANHDIIQRLAGYIDRKPQPLELLAYVNDLRPRSIYFTKVSVEGGLQMVIEGATNVLAEINEFEAALKRSPAFAGVEVKNIRAREGGGTFQLMLSFRPGFQAGTPAPVAGKPAPEAVAAPAVVAKLPPTMTGAPGMPRMRTPDGDPRRGRMGPMPAGSVPNPQPPPAPPADGANEPPPPPP